MFFFYREKICRGLRKAGQHGKLLYFTLYVYGFSWRVTSSTRGPKVALRLASRARCFALVNLAKWHPVVGHFWATTALEARFRGRKKAQEQGKQGGGFLAIVFALWFITTIFESPREQLRCFILQGKCGHIKQSAFDLFNYMHGRSLQMNTFYTNRR